MVFPHRLGSAGDVSLGTPRFEKLFELLRSNDERNRTRARDELLAMARLPVERLEWELSHAECPRFAGMLCEILARSRTPAAEGALLQQLQTAPEPVVELAVKELWRPNSPRTRRALCEALEGGRGGVAHAALVAMAMGREIGHFSYFRCLAKALKYGTHPTDYDRDPIYPLRASVAWELGKYGTKRAVSVLSKLLSERPVDDTVPHRHVLFECVAALRAIGSAEAHAALEAAREHPLATVSNAVREYLVRHPNG